MRKLKIILTFILTFVFVIFSFQETAVFADDNYVSLENKASIRIKTDKSSQGLRFTASLNKNHSYVEHGFYLAYGNVTTQELMDALVLESYPPIINDREVFKVALSGVTDENKFSVVLTGIPKEGYFDEISVFAYVILENYRTIIEGPTTKSVSEIALKMANDGFEINKILDFEAILNSSNKIVSSYPDGSIFITSSLIETNYESLKEEFIKDWNNQFSTNWTSLKADTFHNSAKAGISEPITANYDLSSSNLYNFFNNAKSVSKWGWLLDFLNDSTDIIEINEQVEALKTDGSYNDKSLFHCLHLNYSIANFFNCDNEESNYQAIDFLNSSSYLNIRNYNNYIYVNLNKTSLSSAGNLFTLPFLEPKDGYIFNSYSVNGESFLAGDSFLIPKDNIVIKPVYLPINYTIEFYDKTVLYDDYTKVYTIEDSFMFETPTKEGYKFLGWYEDYNFKGVNKANIDRGSTGEKTFYARWEEIIDPVDPTADYDISFNLNGGEFKNIGAHEAYTNRDKMILDFLTDFYNFLNPSSLTLNDFLHGSGNTTGFAGSYNSYIDDLRPLIKDTTINPTTNKFINQAEYNKWLPVIDMMDEYTSSGNPSQTGQFWTSNYVAEPRFKQFVRKENPWGEAEAEMVLEITKRIPNQLKVENPGIKIEVPNSYNINSETITLPVPNKFNDTFVGWYNNPYFAGESITQIIKGSTGDKTFYALWESIDVVAEPEFLKFEVSEITLNINEEYTLTPLVGGLNNYELLYTTSDKNIVSLIDDGKIKALSAGKAEISVKVQGTLTKASILITVIDENIKPEIVLESDLVGLLVTDETTINYQVKNIKEFTLLWSSSDESVVTVNQMGLIKALKVGQAKITLIIEGTGVFKTINVFVEKDLNIIITYNSKNCQDNTIQLFAQIIPEKFDQDVIWSSSNDNIAEVLSNGLVIVKESGDVTFTASLKTNNSIEQTLSVHFEYSKEDGVLITEIEIEI